MTYYAAPSWSFTSAIVPLTYLRLYLPDIISLVKIMLTPPLSDTLRQLHVQTNNYIDRSSSFPSASIVSIEMVNLHTFTLAQAFFYNFPIDWAHVELLTSSKVMPALRRANIALFMEINDFNRIRTTPLFIDQRRVEVNFAFTLVRSVNNLQYKEMTQFIPCGSHSHPREVVGATCVVDYWLATTERVADADPYVSGHFMILFLRFSHSIKQKA